jgi:hypothetical protein
MGGKKKDTDDWLAGIADDLKAIKDGPSDILKVVEKAIEKIEALPDRLALAIWSRIPTYMGGGGGLSSEADLAKPIRRGADGRLHAF